MEPAKKKIVILGAGFGGIKAAFELCKNLSKLKLEDKYQIFLVDKNQHHTYTPTLYEIATTSKVLASQIDLKSIVTFSLENIFAGKNVILVQGLVTNVDLTGGDIHLESGEKLKFDYLILALGSETNYFGIPGLKENSLTLKTFVDAIKIRDAVWHKIEGLKDFPDNEVKIVIGGAGATGVELASEIKSWLCQLQKELQQCNASVTIIEGMPNILPGFNQPAIEKVTRRLRKIGVELLLNEFIERAEKEKVVLKSGRVVDFDILIWTGGVKAVSLMGAMPLKKEQKGRVQVIEEMECLPQSEDLKLYGKIYGLGDAICFYDPETNKPIPLVAEAAIKQAKVIAHNIMEDIKFAEGITPHAHHKKFRPKQYSYIIPVGGKYAVAKIGPFIISGFSGWILKGLVEIYYLLFNVLPPMQAIKAWLKGLNIFIKNDRLG